MEKRNHIVYKNATVEEIVEHFKKITPSAFHYAGKGYLERGDVETHEKVLKAKELFDVWRQEQRDIKLLAKIEEKKFRIMHGPKGEKHVDRAHAVWRGLRGRTVKDGHFQNRFSHYTGCECAEEFDNFESFKAWCIVQAGWDKKDNKGQWWELDKDILNKGGKLYSPETCVFVPAQINTFVRPIREGKAGVFKTMHGTYRATIKVEGVSKYIGSYETEQEAFEAYKAAKIELAKILADRYKDQLDSRVYEVLMDYGTYLNK